MFRFNHKYFIAAVIILLVEIYIALFVRDAWIRPYGGDFLVVILMYCTVKTVLDARYWRTAIGVLAFSYIVEGLQYLRFVERVGLEENRFASVVMGTNFNWADIVCYTLGILLIILMEWVIEKRHRLPSQR